MMQLTGLEVLRAIAAGDAPTPGIATTLGMGVSAVEEGRVVFHLDPDPGHENPLGTVHGGVLATLLDSAMGCAVHSTLPAGATYSTLELSVNYVRPVLAGAGRITAEGTTVHVGGRTATASGRVTSEDGRLVAHAKTTCLIDRP